jgi:hypothetical protein
MRRCFEMAGAFEPTLVINQRVEPLFDIAQRTDGIGRIVFPPYASPIDMAATRETLDFRGSIRKLENSRMSLRESYLAGWVRL